MERRTPLLTFSTGIKIYYACDIDRPNSAGDTFENVKAGASTVAKANGQATVSDMKLYMHLCYEHC